MQIVINKFQKNRSKLKTAQNILFFKLTKVRKVLELYLNFYSLLYITCLNFVEESVCPVLSNL